jgi:hypothetical protein
LNSFDKFCAAPAFLLGIVFLILGVLGLFGGCRANFTLPPILGVAPAFVGWGILRAIYVGWNVPDDRRHPPNQHGDAQWGDDEFRP